MRWARRRISRAVTSAPSTSMRPESGFSTPAINRSRVDLPLALGPRIDHLAAMGFEADWAEGEGRRGAVRGGIGETCLLDAQARRCIFHRHGLLRTCQVNVLFALQKIRTGSAPGIRVHRTRRRIR